MSAAVGFIAGMCRTLVTLESDNAKTGRVAAIYRTQVSCPKTCPLYNSGCYARGRIFGIPAKNGIETGPEDDYARVRELAVLVPYGGTIRANVSGDYFNVSPDGEPGGSIDYGYIEALNYVATSRPDITLISYTHGWRRLSVDMFRGYQPAASCDTIEDAAAAIAAGWAPVMVSAPAGDPGSRFGLKIAGRPVIPCVFETHERQCVDCGLCARTQRAIVGFTAHGSGRNQAVTAIASAEAAAIEALELAGAIEARA